MSIKIELWLRKELNTDIFHIQDATKKHNKNTLKYSTLF